MLALAYEAVSKRYGDTRALEDLTLGIAEGETFGLLGPNGAGKTTLIRLALDLVRPDAGEVRLFGRRPGPETLQLIAYLPEERGLYRDVPVIDVLLYLGRLKGLATAETRKRALAWLERVGLPGIGGRRVDSLSKGMSQKVQLVAALFTEPRLAILDEPFSGLDPVNARLVTDLLAEREAAGGTTILSTHQMDRAEALARRIGLLHRGRLLHVGTVAELRASRDAPTESLESLFVRLVSAREVAA